MKLETKNNIRILTPSEGMWLCNMTSKVISDKVYLGKNASETEWIEIDDSEKARLETLWESQTESSETDSDYAEAGKILMGVCE